MATPKKSKAKLNKNNTSGYIGVTKSKANGKFIATFNGKKLGRFKTAVEAAKRHDEIAYANLGDKANLNFPSDYPKTIETVLPM